MTFVVTVGLKPVTL